MKIIIDIRDGVDEVTAMERVLHVIKGGRISNNGKLFCYHTAWQDNIHVSVRDYRKNDCFVVYKRK